MENRTTAGDTRTVTHLRRVLDGGDKMSSVGTPASSSGLISQGAALGRYLVLYRIGSGGMGEAFAAYDPHLDRKVAQLSRSSERAAGQELAEGLPRGLRQTLRRGLAEKPEDRFADLPELLDRLTPSKPRRGLLAAAALVFVGALLLAALWPDGPGCDGGEDKWVGLAEPVFREALALASAHELRSTSRLEIGLAKALHFPGRGPEAWPHAKQVLAQVDPGEATEDFLRIEVLIVSGGVARELGDLEEADRYHRQAGQLLAEEVTSTFHPKLPDRKI